MVPVARSYDKEGKVNLHFFLKIGDLMKKVKSVKIGPLVKEEEWEKLWEIGQSVATIILFLISIIISVCKRNVQHQDNFLELPQYQRNE